MLLPSLYRSGNAARAWSVTRAALYGAAIGAFAAVFKMLAPLHAGAAAAPWRSLPPGAAVEIVAAAFVFAALCAGAALLRNLLIRRSGGDGAS